MTQIEDYIEKEGTEELNNIVKTSNSYTRKLSYSNANYKTWFVGQLSVAYAYYLGRVGNNALRNNYYILY